MRSRLVVAYATLAIMVILLAVGSPIGGGVVRAGLPESPPNCVRDVCGVCGGDGTSCLDCNNVPNGGAQLDICGVCDGDGTSCLDCNDVPNGDAVLDECGECDGDGSTCATCGVTEVTVAKVLGQSGDSFTTVAEILVGDPVVPQCVEDYVGEALQICKDLFSYLKEHSLNDTLPPELNNFRGFPAETFDRTVDDCVYEIVSYADNLPGNPINTASHSSLINFVFPNHSFEFGVLAAQLAGVPLAENQLFGPEFVGRFVRRTYVDDDCNEVSLMDVFNGVVAVGCRALIEIIQTPISFIWDEECVAQESPTITSFPIDPNHDDRWYSWRASSCAPLLVWDPEQQGKITSGAQLFGSWTFDGRVRDQLASLQVEIPNGGSSREQWSNGYEPLALLDRDEDGKISGNELAPLALWFDANRNGVSEPGEVKPLSSLDVSEIFYQPDQEQLEVGVIQATRGYTRVIDGAPQVFRSIDWTTDSGSSPLEALTLSEGIKELCEEPRLAPEHVEPVEVDNSNELVAAIDMKNIGTLTGVWRWQYESGSIKAPKGLGGILTFRELPGNKIEGTAITEAKFKKALGPAKAIIRSNDFVGSFSARKGGLRQFQIKVGGTEEVVLVSTVTISKDEKMLRGVTEGRTAEGATFSYTWTAKKLQ